jgi:Fe-Mn family superoxide dismutase
MKKGVTHMGNRRTSILDRRKFIIQTSFGTAALSAAWASSDSAPAAGQASAPALPPLPYPPGALAPSISENTISFHYGKHHQAYLNNMIKMIAGTPFEKAPLEEVIRATAGKPDQAGLFNNAAQVYNHTFYWNSMTPGGGGEPQGRLAALLKDSFGGYGKFVEAFSNAAATQFGSGWAWLVQEGGKLKVVKTPNAETPITMGVRPLITIDVWEHAYYLDYQNRRADYIKAFVDRLLNWSFAEKNLSG